MGLHHDLEQPRDVTDPNHVTSRCRRRKNTPPETAPRQRSERRGNSHQGAALGKARRKTPADGVNGFLSPEVREPEVIAEASSRTSGKSPSLLRSKKKSRDSDPEHQGESNPEEPGYSPVLYPEGKKDPENPGHAPGVPDGRDSPEEMYAKVDKNRNKPVHPGTPDSTTLPRAQGNPNTEESIEEMYATVDKNRNKPIQPSRPKDTPPSSPGLKPAIPKKPKPETGDRGKDDNNTRDTGKENNKGDLYQNVGGARSGPADLYENVSQSESRDSADSAAAPQPISDELYATANEGGRRPAIGGANSYVNVKDGDHDDGDADADDAASRRERDVRASSRISRL